MEIIRTNKKEYRCNNAWVTVDFTERDYPVVSHVYITTQYEGERDKGAVGQLQDIVDELETIMNDIQANM